MGKKNKLVHGVGINDAEFPIYVNGKNIPSYRAWTCMLQRCYSSKHHARRPTYIGCSVCTEWLSFSNFHEWFEKHHVDGWQLDKDLLNTGNKLYSPEICVYIPQQINSFMLESGNSRGEFPIGVRFQNGSKKNPFQAQCWSPSTGKQEYLGLFSTPEAAHDAWKKAKHKGALYLCDKYAGKVDQRVLDALMKRYPDSN